MSRKTLTRPEGVEPLLPSSSVAAQLGITEGHLAQTRYMGTGPAFIKLGARTVRYRQSAVDAWLANMERQRTDDRPGAA